MPDACAERAWSAYLRALRDGKYWLSVDEVLGMCVVANVSIVVLTELPGRRLRLAGHHVVGPN